MPIRREPFPHWSRHSRSPTVPSRSQGVGVCVLPCIPESPTLQDSRKGLSHAPVRTRTSPFLYSLPLRKAFSPPRPSGSKAVMDSFIYENWRVHPHGPTPRRAFEDNCVEQGKRGSLYDRPLRCRGEDALKHSVTRGSSSDQCHGNRPRRYGGGSCSTIIRSSRTKDHEQQENHVLTDSSNKMKSLSVYDFYKRCKIDCWNKINSCSVFKS
ncbi:hypothetical protein AGOR_G00118580 [Albula goreensis]|uniref:Uncharacterized protein n=1 Tax=Albula goreensis TaxID=1534307 RepID=A0A8T3DBQ6_9TELE|nr:hypothetical protein AGOR_G00118580 [Albula goreensis]